MIDKRPLAERMRPNNIYEYIGQKHIIGDGTPLRMAIEKGSIPSMILWGPPGVGKTSLANIISKTIDAPFYSLSAINSGVKDIRDLVDEIQKSNEGLFSTRQRAILFIDEIHRFSKSQQDSLLPIVEKGIVTLIGASTENPSFEIIKALLSRSQVYVLKPLDKEDIKRLIDNAIANDELLKTKHIEVLSYDAIFHLSSGDARRALNILEIIFSYSIDEKIIIDDDLVEKLVNKNPIAFDKGGELHYDLASALIKSIRGSDPDAAIYYLARLIEGGEDPSFIARRLSISAVEDVGLANPNAILLAEATAASVERIGWPESRIALAELTIYLATAEKSNTAYNAINKALEFVRATGNQSIPLHLRNGVTSMMRELNYGKDYKYPHDYPNHFIEQEYLPETIKGTKFYEASKDNAIERQIIERQSKRWKK